MDIAIIIGLVTIWLTIVGLALGLTFKVINVQIHLKKDLEQKIKESENLLREETKENINLLREETKENINLLREETRDIRKEIASLYRILVSQNRYYDDPEDKKLA